jgi:hypothetical protein
MHGPLICYECRIFLKEDEEHEKEQQAYEDRRQANYKPQIAGDNDMTQTDKQATDKAAQHTNNDGHTYEALPSPSPPRDLPQNFTRISIAKLLQNRKDGQIQQRTKQTISPRPNPFRYLQEIQDPPPIPRWTEHLLRYQIDFLQNKREKVPTHADLWDRLLPFAEITLNVMRSWRPDPSLSAWSGLHRLSYDFSAHPIHPPGQLCLAFSDPDHRYT